MHPTSNRSFCASKSSTCKPTRSIGPALQVSVSPIGATTRHSLARTTAVASLARLPLLTLLLPASPPPAPPGLPDRPSPPLRSPPLLLALFGLRPPPSPAPRPSSPSPLALASPPPLQALPPAASVGFQLACHRHRPRARPSTLGDEHRWAARPTHAACLPKVPEEQAQRSQPCGRGTATSSG